MKPAEGFDTHRRISGTSSLNPATVENRAQACGRIDLGVRYGLPRAAHLSAGLAHYVALLYRCMPPDRQIKPLARILYGLAWLMLPREVGSGRFYGVP